MVNNPNFDDGLDEIVGPCCVCGKLVFERDLCGCEWCAQAFHWSRCGGWVGNEQRCNNCKDVGMEQ